MTHLPARRPTAPKALVAAATRMDRISKNAQHVHGLISVDEWQREAWRQYDINGELGYIATYKANTCSKARLIAARLVPGETPEPLGPDHPASQAVDALFGGRHGHPEAIKRIIPQLMVSGVSYIVAFDSEDPDSVTRATRMADGTNREWHILSSEEISVNGDMFTINIAGQRIERSRASTVVIRCWTPHARAWWQPDSAVRRLLPVLRELEGLTKHVGATIDSRLAGAGLLVVPQELSFVSNREDLADDDDPFVVELMEAMSTAIADRASASALVPLVIRVPGEMVDRVKHIRFATEFDERTNGLREEAIRRIALGLDIPPEVLLGMADANHWTAWQVEESSVKIHVEPALEAICSALTVGWLHPLLEDETDVEDLADIICWYDTTPLKLRPNRTQDATLAHDRLLIDDAALRRALGFGESDAPTGEDLQKQLVRYVLVNAPQLALDILPMLGVDVPEARRDDNDSNAPDSRQGNDADNDLPDKGTRPVDDSRGADGLAAAVSVLQENGHLSGLSL